MEAETDPENCSTAKVTCNNNFQGLLVFDKSLHLLLLLCWVSWSIFCNAILILQI